METDQSNDVFSEHCSSLLPFLLKSFQSEIRVQHKFPEVDNATTNAVIKNVKVSVVGVPKKPTHMYNNFLSPSFHWEKNVLSFVIGAIRYEPYISWI